jgi:hypothetical protein
MKFFGFFVAVLMIIGSASAQTNYSTIPSELERLFNVSDVDVNNLINNVVSRIQGRFDRSINRTVGAYKIFRPFVTSLLTALQSSPLLTAVDAGINATVSTYITEFNDRALRNRTVLFTTSARSNYSSEIRQFARSLFNASSAVYQCWNASKDKIEVAVDTFVDTTFNETLPLLQTSDSTVDNALEKVLTNFTTLQVQSVTSCLQLNIFTIPKCRFDFVSSITH